MSEAFKLIAPVRHSRPTPTLRQPRAQQVAQLRIADQVTVDVVERADSTPAPDEVFRRTFSDADIKLIIVTLREAAQEIAREPRAQLADLETAEREARATAAQEEDVARQHRERALEIRERAGAGGLDSAAQAAIQREQQQAKLRDESASKSRQAAADALDERHALQASWSGVEGLIRNGRGLLAVLPQLCAVWRRGDGPDAGEDAQRRAHVAYLLPQARTLPALAIIAQHALRLAWTDQQPRRWLARAGYHPAPDTGSTGRGAGDPGVWRVLDDLRYHDGAVIPAGTTLQGLWRAELGAVAHRAVRETQRGLRNQAGDARWRFYAEVEHHLAPHQRQQLHRRLAVWADNNYLDTRPLNPFAPVEDASGSDEATRRALRMRAWREWAERTLTPTGKRGWKGWLHQRAREQGRMAPPAAPELVVFRWPSDQPDAPVRYGLVGIDLHRAGDRGEVVTAPALPEPPPAPAAPMLFTTSVVVVDVETTGMSGRAEVVEIGAVVLDRWGNEIDHFESLARPLGSLQTNEARNALRINGIKAAELSLIHI